MSRGGAGGRGPASRDGFAAGHPRDAAFPPRGAAPRRNLVAELTLHEVLKQEMAAETGDDTPYGGVSISSDVARGSDVEERERLSRTETGLEDVYVLLDSRFKEEHSSNAHRGRYRFNLNPEGSGGGGGISMTGAIREAIEIAVDPFVIPAPLTKSRGFQAHDDATAALASVSSFYNDTSVAVTAGTTAALAAATYANGASGVGATLTADANGALPAQDTIALVATDRLLVRNQASAVENGVYVVTDAGSGATPWILTRASDSDSSGELTVNVYEPSSGATLSGVRYLVPYSAVAIGTDDIDFVAAYDVAAYIDPIVSSATVVSHPFGSIPPSGHVRMQIREIPRQAFLSFKDGSHHVELSSELVEGAAVGATGETQQMLRLTPLATSDGHFIFSRPVRELSHLEVDLYGGGVPLPLPIDSFSATVDVQGGGVRLSWPPSRIGDLIDRPTAEGGGKYFPVAVGDRIFVAGAVINNAAPPNARFPDLEAFVNRDEGLLVASLTDTGDGTGNQYVGVFPTVVGLPAGSIGFDGSSASSMVVRVFVAKALVRIPLRFRCIAPAPTNSIVAV